jgi:lipopolysaccharide biosynthesis regulator YciM
MIKFFKLLLLSQKLYYKYFDEFEEARKLLRKNLELKPSDVESKIHLAKIDMKEKKFDNAISNLKYFRVLRV